MTMQNDNYVVILSPARCGAKDLPRMRATVLAFARDPSTSLGMTQTSILNCHFYFCTLHFELRMLLGERLRKAREDSSLTLKKFSELSKVPQKYLERLEGGNYEKLPAFVYIQGFLRKYSQAFNIPLQDLIALYHKETAGIDLPKEQKIQELSSLDAPRFLVTPKKIKMALILLAVLGVAAYFTYQLDFLLAAPKLSLDYPFEDLSISRSSIEVSGSAHYASILTINGQQVFVDDSGAFKQEINLSPGMNTLKIEAKNRFGKASEIIRQIIVK